ncbi:MAG: hypothetical protein HUK03_05970, partial [Bacteroidaceae bacterium]|nr:hypothetical protein [Bacteroidaceae bacterium]
AGELKNAIEDNGWGYGAFFPTTVRTSLTDNWASGFVPANSSKRLKMLDLNYCPAATGGAPYLRQAPDGTTIMSYQSDYMRNGTLEMLVGVGDEKARNFKALSHPFAYVPNRPILWNSLAIVEDSVVLAVGGVQNTIEVVKGYLKTQFECPYASPKVDGRYLVSDKYYGRTNPQVHIGNELGFACQYDFAFDADSLYFLARVYDNSMTYSGTDMDGVRLSIESKGRSTNNVTTSAYQYLFTLGGTVTRSYGQGTAFKVKTGSNAHMVAKRYSGYYIMEMAMPWSDFGLTSAPAGTALRVNIEAINATSDGVHTEMIADGRDTEPWTWMPLQLANVPTTVQAVSAQKGVTISARQGQLVVESESDIKHARIYDLSGRMLATLRAGGRRIATALPRKKMLLVEVATTNGTTKQKILL